MRRPTDTSTGTKASSAHPGRRRGIIIALLACLVASAFLAIPGTPALAAFNHNVVEDVFKVSGTCQRTRDIALDEDDELIYVSCHNGEFLYWGGSTSPVDVIRRFNYDGEPVAFTAVSPYIEDNELKNDPGNLPKVFFHTAEIAVDNSNTFNNGRLYVTSAQDLEVFEPDGSYLLSIFQPTENLSPNRLEGVDVDEDGYMYLTKQRPFSPIKKYDTGFKEVERLYRAPGGTPFHHIRVDSKGSVWAGWETSGNPQTRQLDKYEPDQFTTELEPTPFEVPAGGLERFYAQKSPFYDSPLLSAPVNSVRRFDVDLTNDDLYVVRGDRIEVFSSGDAEEFAHKDAPDFGVGDLEDSIAVAVTKDHKVFASREGSEGPEIVRFGPGDVVPDVRTEKPGLDDVGHTSVQVAGEVELAGGSPVVRCEIEYGLNTNYAETPVPCTPDPAESPPGSNFAANTPVSGELTGLTTNATYHYRINAENEAGENWGIDRVVTPPHILKVQTLPATEIDQNGGMLNGSFDPDGLETTYKFRYGPTTEYGFETAAQPGGSGSGTVAVGTEVNSLPQGRVFHYQVVAENENGTTVGPDMTFRTASTPDIEGVRASGIEPTSAVLHATINPVGYATTYQFEYGPTPEYGQVAPAEGVAIGGGTSPVEVTRKLEGLQPGITYYYRVVAENQWGQTLGDETTFDYAPPSCPNDYVRQLTLGSYLPDCRAYELVSPPEVGSLILHPSKLVLDVQPFAPGGQYHEGKNYNVNTGLATAPSRFAFWGGLGTVKGLDAPATRQDMFVASRGSGGWETTLPALKGAEASNTGRKECSDSLHMCIDHQEETLWGFDPEASPYMFDISGERLGRLPTNVHIIPGGIDARGAQRISGDGDHYAFSSSDYRRTTGFGDPLFKAVAFAPGGKTDPFGSAYMNDIGARTVEIVSKLPNGEDIPPEAPFTETDRKFNFLGLSPDGSHVLMSTPAGSGGENELHLFMRVDGALTYDVTQGAAAEFVGMARNGSKVLFITDEQLTEDDTDTSGDLYEWAEDGSPTGSLTRVSQGNGAGDSDECSPSWASGDCSVERIAPDYWHPDANEAISAPGLDDIIAEGSGAVYFYSPEVLDSTRLGLINERNLYVYRNGVVRMVAALDADNPIKRMQISPNGAYAGMLTASRLTQYDNKEFDQMYTYNADGRVIRCASCHPTGVPPEEDTYASQGGRFMADDGRTFFATAEDLVPRDANGGKIDVYEYVGGRPQLITTGLAARDFTGGGGQSIVSLPVGDIGLESVSHDGVDVIFSTFETILPEDRNGEFVKFYDARTGGGFARDPNLGPCVAADECHGPDSARPAERTVNSGTNLGAGGNVVQAKKKQPRKCARGKVRRGRRCVSRRSLARRACRAKSGRAARRCMHRQMKRLRAVERRQARRARAANNGRRGK